MGRLTEIVKIRATVGTARPMAVGVGPIDPAMRHRKTLRVPETAGDRQAYELIVRGPDGRLRSERFGDAAAYRARLVSLELRESASLSIEDLAGLLDR